MVASKPKKPKKTAEQSAAEIRQATALDRETEEEQRRLRAMSRKRLGASSLLAGLPGGPQGQRTPGSSGTSSGGSSGGGSTGGGSTGRQRMIR